MFIIIPNDGNVRKIRDLIHRYNDVVFVGDVPALDKKALIIMLHDNDAHELKRIVRELEKKKKAKVIDLLLVKGEKIEEGS